LCQAAAIADDRNTKVVSIGAGDFRQPANNEEIKMSHPKNLAGQSGAFFMLAVAALAICTTGAAVLLMPAEATSKVSATAADAGPGSYFPNEFINQAKEVEPETAYVLEPVAAAPDTSADSTTTYVHPSGYFPGEFINQAKEIEPQPATF
jgi:hypothetical protein